MFMAMAVLTLPQIGFPLAFWFVLERETWDALSHLFCAAAAFGIAAATGAAVFNTDLHWR